MTLLEFRNATYRGIYDAPVTLADGSYAGPPFTPDSLEPPRVELLEGRVARGDVDADGDEDAMELRVESSGGTGRFLHLAVVVDRNGSPRQRRDNQAGDRWRRRELGADRSALASVVVTLELLGDRLIGTAGGNR